MPPDICWAECYGGPADGMTLTITPLDPVPVYPYLTSRGELVYYELRVDPHGTYKFFLQGMIIPDTWCRPDENDATSR
jgi:hypothetical protein